MAEFDLGKQVGPLPLGAWIAVVGGGLTIGYFVSRNQSKADSTQTPVAEPGVGTGGGQFIYEPPQDVSAPEEEQTNDAWGRKVVNWLIGRGMTPYKADNTVRKYLSGEPLEAAESAMMNLALAQFGAPPEPIQPVEQPETPTEPEDDDAGFGPPANVFLYKAGKNIIVEWPPVPGADRYQVILAGFGGKFTWRRATTTSVRHTFKNVYAPFRHSVSVYPIRDNKFPPDGWPGGAHRVGTIAI